MPGIGQNISRFRILEKIGEGGMGVVYKAHDTTLHRTVALKFLSKRPASSADEESRLLLEARAAAALNHPGICSLIDIIVHEGEQFIVMEFVEGDSLRATLARGRMSTEKILAAAVQIGEALAEAHRRGIVHRDIKPDNVILTPESRIKVMDFGLARQAGRPHITREGSMVGTTAYLSPEQARGEEVDHRTDIWSFGVVLYEACTGTSPFGSEYDQAVLYGILHETPRSPRSLNPAVSERLERVILRCLEKIPEHRYLRMEECLADLKGVDSNRDASQRYPSVSGGKRWLPPRGVAITFGVLILTAAAVLFWPHDHKAEMRSSVAVLPFKNLSNNDDDAFFAEGLTEDIISQLGTVRGLKVIGHSSVLRYKNTEKPFAEIASELGTATLLEGSVRHAGGRIRVVARLVDHATGEGLWNDTYDRNSEDILAIQSDIARNISAALKGQILADSGHPSGRPFNLEAWRFYQKGKIEWYKRSTEGIRAAKSYFEKALDLDPDFALAHAGLADALALLGDTGVLSANPTESFSKAKQEALKALSLDGTLAEGYASLGHVQMHQFEWRQAEQSLRRAVELNPNSPIAQLWLGIFCVAVGKTEEVRERVQNALLVDPISIYTTSTAAALYFRLGQSDSGVAILTRMLRIEPSSPRLHFVLGRTYSVMHRPDEALKELQITRVRENNTEVRAAVAQAYALAGRTQEALAIVDSLTGPLGKDFLDPVRIAEVYAALGRKEDAFAWLDRALHTESAAIIFLKSDPWYDALHPDPRYKAILKAMGVDSF